jgi:phosphate starvation-inducible membrane PsiE
LIEGFITLIIWIIVFAIAAYGMYWICVKFQFPRPVFWLCGALLLLVILLFLVRQAGMPIALPG